MIDIIIEIMIGCQKLTTKPVYATDENILIPLATGANE